jgi:hypothetical protein
MPYAANPVPVEAQPLIALCAVTSRMEANTTTVGNKVHPRIAPTPLTMLMNPAKPSRG